MRKTRSRTVTHKRASQDVRESGECICMLQGVVCVLFDIILFFMQLLMMIYHVTFF